MYKSLSAEEKQRWEAHAAQDKARYEAEMASYVPPAGYDAQGSLVEERRFNKKYMKKQKDPDQPKRARGSFVFFTFDMRPQVTKEFPGIKFVEMGTVLGERWRALNAEEKSKYEDMAQEDKQRFNKEMEEYSARRIAENPGLAHAEAAAAAISHGHAYPPAGHMPPQAYARAPPHAEHHHPQYDYAAHHGHYDPNVYAHHPQHMDPNAHHDPNAHPDPYAQHAAYAQGYGQYHYA